MKTQHVKTRFLIKVTLIIALFMIGFSFEPAGFNSPGALLAQTVSPKDNSPCPVFIISFSYKRVSCYGGNDGSALAIPIGGAYPYTYSWSDASSNVISTSDPTGNILSAGSYTVTVTDANGCSMTSRATVHQPRAIVITPTVVSNVSCHGGSNGNASASVSGGVSPYQYSWSNGSSTISTSSSTGPILTAGTYTFTVTDWHGCVASKTVNITQPYPLYVDVPLATNVSCVNGTATASPSGGTSPYTYLWSPGGQTNKIATGLSVGTYSVTLNDINGCAGWTATVKIGYNPLRDSISSVIHNKCAGTASGQATVGVKGGTLPYTYLWSNSATVKTVQTLSNGTYTVTVTDKNNCTTTASVTITSPSALTGSLVSMTGPTCYSQSNGNATVAAQGGISPYTYAWTPNVGNSPTVTGLSCRAYGVIIKDNNGCTVPVNFFVTQPVAIVNTIVSTTKTSCNGGADGAATVAAKYGVEPYTYTWTPGDYDGATVTGLSAGVYTVTCFDANGCQANTITVNISQPGDLRDSITKSSCTNNLITATVGVKLGTPPYTFLWLPGGGAKYTMVGLTPGTYTITVTDNHGCFTVITPKLTCALLDLPESNGGDASSVNMERINLYPNPNTGEFTVAGLEKGMILEMYDYTGRRISAIVASESTMQLNISYQPKGIYLIRILDNNGNLVSQKKVVKTN